MSLKDRLTAGIQAYKGGDKLYFSLDPLLASIKKDLLEVIGEDEHYHKDDPRHKLSGELFEWAERNALRAEQRERLERYIGSKDE